MWDCPVKRISKLMREVISLQRRNPVPLSLLWNRSVDSQKAVWKRNSDNGNWISKKLYWNDVPGQRSEIIAKTKQLLDLNTKRFLVLDYTYIQNIANWSTSKMVDRTVNWPLGNWFESCTIDLINRISKHFPLFLSHPQKRWGIIFEYSDNFLHFEMYLVSHDNSLSYLFGLCCKYVVMLAISRFLMAYIVHLNKHSNSRHTSAICKLIFCRPKIF